ncbi:hypothetical protein LXA43DRAFT_973080 [Ganoderma leucocontextum]|nr:hypothetical protein LXA43DRAFT_973080 [Ganoderma leucocontextum]
MSDPEEPPSYATWVPPVYDMNSRPRQLYSTHLPQSQANTEGTDDPYIFARMAKWCPDGSVALAQCEDRSFSPPELLGVSIDATASTSLPKSLTQSSPILDYAWYPTASPRDPASFCFVASVRECPVKLLDASDGRLRASYRIVDHRERQVAPHSVAFNVGANKLYCGFEDAIEVFDIHRPGEGTRLRTTPSKKSRDGLKGEFSRTSPRLRAQTYSVRCLSAGIVSALAFAPDVSSDLYAAGSFSPSSPSSSNIAIFSEANGDVPIMFVGAEDRQPGGGAGYGVRASVSQLMFNPARPFLLFASFRRVDEIYCWDLRGDVSRPVEVFSTHPTLPIRNLTNQRLRFDLDFGGNWLAVGEEGGGVSVFDLAVPNSTVGGKGQESGPPSSPMSTPPTMPTLRYDAHGDAVGSVAFHPLRPLLLSVSGSRHFDHVDVASRVSSDSSTSDSEGDLEGHTECPPTRRSTHAVKRSRNKPQPVALDTTIKLWGFGQEASSGGQERGE